MVADVLRLRAYRPMSAGIVAACVSVSLLVCGAVRLQRYDFYFDVVG